MLALALKNFIIAYLIIWIVHFLIKHRQVHIGVHDRIETMAVKFPVVEEEEAAINIPRPVVVVEEEAEDLDRWFKEKKSTPEQSLDALFESTVKAPPKTTNQDFSMQNISGLDGWDATFEAYEKLM